MAERAQLLDSRQMARFVARGFLAFPGVVPEALNQRFREQVEGAGVPEVPAGIPLARAYPEGSAIREMLRLPAVEGALESLVGRGARFDHHFLHPSWSHASQHTHQDSTIDVRTHFDVQILYFPQAVDEEMGGTRFVPGSHLRRVSESAIARYQNIVGQQHVCCPAGSLYFFHHGIWHGAGCNRTTRPRLMFKIRVNPTVRQTRLWNTDDLGPEHDTQRPIFWVRESDPEHVHSILCQPEPWFEMDTSRLEFLNRIRLWRFLLGDPDFDADYWLTRIENTP